MKTRIVTAWRRHRRLIIVAGCMLAGLLALLVATGLVVRLSGGGASQPSARAVHPVVAGSASASTDHATAGGGATDVAFWNAQPTIAPAASTAFPAVSVADRSDPDAYATAFAKELFTRAYTSSSRAQLLAWAQYEDAPLRSPHYPRSDWTKVLANSLTDLTWDQATDTPVPAQAVWLALAQDHTTTHVADVTARVDPQWEQKMSDGYTPPDPLTTVWDVSLQVTSTGSSGRHVYDVSIALQLGTSSRGLYGVAATNNYVIREVH